LTIKLTPHTPRSILLALLFTSALFSQSRANLLLPVRYSVVKDPLHLRRCLPLHRPQMNTDKHRFF